MKLIKTTSDGYINADKIEAYCVEYRKITDYYYICAYTPTYALEESCTKYVLGEIKNGTDSHHPEFNSYDEAYVRLATLAEWLSDDDKDGVFDCMHLWESDYDELD